MYCILYGNVGFINLKPKLLLYKVSIGKKRLYKNYEQLHVLECCWVNNYYGFRLFLYRL